MTFTPLKHSAQDNLLSKCLPVDLIYYKHHTSILKLRSPFLPDTLLTFKVLWSYGHIKTQCLVKRSSGVKVGGTCERKTMLHMSIHHQETDWIMPEREHHQDAWLKVMETHYNPSSKQIVLDDDSQCTQCQINGAIQEQLCLSGKIKVTQTIQQAICKQFNGNAESRGME